MPLAAWALAAVAVSILLALYALPWLVVLRSFLKPVSKPDTEDVELSKLRVELDELRAKYPPRTDET